VSRARYFYIRKHIRFGPGSRNERAEKEVLAREGNCGITVSHVLQFANEPGPKLSATEAAQFLNQNGLAQNVWIHMMQAGEEFIESNRQTRGTVPGTCRSSSAQAAMVQ